MRGLLLASLLLLALFKMQAVAGPKQPGERKNIDRLIAQARNNALRVPQHARQTATEALLRSKHIGYDEGIGLSFKLIGNTYWAQAYFPLAIYYLSSALPYFKNNPQLAAECYSTLGRCNADMKRFATADSLFKIAIRLAGNSEEQLADIFAERSEMYRQAKDLPRAFSDAFNGLRYARSNDNKEIIAILGNRLYTLYNASGRYDSAVFWLDSSMVLSHQLHNNRLRATNYVISSLEARRKKDFARAIPLAEKALALADSIGVIKIAGNASANLYKAYEEMNDAASALRYYKVYQQYQEKLAKLNRDQTIQILQDYSTLQQKLSDIEELQKRNERNNAVVKSQRIAIGFLLFSVALLVVMLLIGAKYYKQKKEMANRLIAHNKQIRNQKQIIARQSQHLKELNDGKDRIMGIIGHDLRSPVANLRSLVELFKNGMIEPQQITPLMKNLATAITSVEFTLDNLLKWSISQQKTTIVESKPVDLLNVIAEAEQIFEYPLQQKNLTLEYEVKTTGQALVNENHLKAIIHNLLSNAIKFTASGGAITLCVYAKDQLLYVDVKDTGQGMNPEEVSNLFRHKTHFTKRGTDGEKGTGMGLILCHELVTRNDGNISVNSAPGQGTTFTVSLPLFLN